MRNIILTGIPRSGTTLAASLLDAQPNTICLNEPEWHMPQASLDAQGFAHAVTKDFGRVREALLMGEPVPDRRGRNGEALTNYFDPDGAKAFVMYPLARELPVNFTLAMKHNGPYLAVLPELIREGCFEIRAVVRHPLPVLRSWRRLDVPVSRGQMPGATRYWREMRELLALELPLLEKQVKMFSLMFERIMAHSDVVQVVRYEELKGNAGGQLSEQQGNEDEMILAMLSQHASAALKYFSQ